MYELLAAVANSSTGLPASTYTGIGGSSGVVLLAFIVFIIARRIYRAAKGSRFSVRAVYMLPAIYLVITILALAAELVISPDYAEVAIAAGLVAAVAGYMIGRRLAGEVKFFEKNGMTYYKRSPLIISLWLISFIARYALEYLYPGGFIISLIIDIVLAGTSGMILGEAHHITNAYKQYSKPVSGKGTE